MTTGTVIIQTALQNIGAHSVISPASPETLAIGLRALNSMMELWTSRNIRIGVTPLSVIGDELEESPDTYLAITSNLSLALAPNFDNGGNVVSKDLKGLAAREFAAVSTLYQRLTIPTKVISSTSPLGQGNRRTFAG